MNIIVLATSFLLLRYFIYSGSLLEYIISFFIIFLSQVVLSLQLLGIAGGLYLRNVIILNLVVLIAVILFVKILKIKPKDDILKRLQLILNNIKLNKIEIFCLSVILGFGLIKVFINLINPPFGWDNLNYHFTFPVEWLKHGNLNTPLVVSDDPAPSYYPINGALFFLWLMLSFKSVFLADLAGVLFFIICGLLVYAISKMLDLERKLSFYAAVLFLLIPNFFKQLEIAYVDVMVAAFFLGVVYYFLKLNEEFNLKNTVLGGISAGLLIGTKSLALLYALTLLLPVFYLCLLKAKRKGAVYLLVFLSLTVLFGGFSYIRNFILTGNPVYPLEVQLLGKTFLKGVIDRASHGAHFLSQDYKISKILFHEGLGLQTLLFALPGAFLGLPLLLKRKNRLKGFRLYLFFLPLVLFFFWRNVITLHNARYLYPALAIAMVAGFYIFQLSRLPGKIATILTIICVLASVSELAGHGELIISLLLAAALFFLLLKNYLCLKFIAFTLILFILAMPFLERDYVKNEFNRYKRSPFWKEAVFSWIWLNEHTQKENISYVGRPVPFPLYGSRFKNNVYYTSVNNTDPVKLHFFKNSHYQWKHDFESCHKNYEEENNYRGRADYKVWLNNLKRRNTDYLFVYSLHQTKTVIFPLEDKWALTHPEVFKQAFSNETIHIYKVIK